MTVLIFCWSYEVWCTHMLSWLTSVALLFYFSPHLCPFLTAGIALKYAILSERETVVDFKIIISLLPLMLFTNVNFALSSTLKSCKYVEVEKGVAQSADKTSHFGSTQSLYNCNALSFAQFSPTAPGLTLFLQHFYPKINNFILDATYIRPLHCLTVHDHSVHVLYPLCVTASHHGYLWLAWHLIILIETESADAQCAPERSLIAEISEMYYQALIQRAVAHQASLKLMIIHKEAKLASYDGKVEQLHLVAMRCKIHDRNSEKDEEPHVHVTRLSISF